MINWVKEQKIDSLKFLRENFNICIKEKKEDLCVINNSRVNLGIAEGLEDFDDFIDFLTISKNPIFDIIKLKKTEKYT